jgi:hypothetical protein
MKNMSQPTTTTTLPQYITIFMQHYFYRNRTPKFNAANIRSVKAIPLQVWKALRVPGV